MRIALAIVCLVCGLAACNEQPPAPTLKELTQLAQSGDVDAQYSLAEFFSDDASDAPDYAKAVEWYLSAATGGKSGAESDLQALAAQNESAFGALAASADGGNATAQSLLGDLYDDGEGSILQDQELALKWYRLAAEQNHSGAQFALGYKYSQGKGVPKDVVKAAEWYLAATKTEDSTGWMGAARMNLEILYTDDKSAPHDPEHLVAWYQFGAENGVASAQLLLGAAYADGDGVPVDNARAVTWWTSAATNDKGFKHIRALAQRLLGDAYFERRKGVAQNDKEALDWYLLSADYGEPRAQYRLGVMYMNGRAVAKDYTEAIRWYSEAAERGDIDAQAALGASYMQGTGVPKDYTEAYFWMNLAARSGSKVAANLRDHIETQLTPEQVLEVQRRTRSWEPREATK